MQDDEHKRDAARTRHFAAMTRETEPGDVGARVNGADRQRPQRLGGCAIEHRHRSHRLLEERQLINAATNPTMGDGTVQPALLPRH